MEDSRAVLGEHQRILGLDVGLRRIGLAVSDGLGVTALGLPTLWRRHMRADLAEIARIARENQATHIVVGHPVNLSGEPGPQAHLVEAFAAKLQNRASLPVYLWDERLTTVEAEEILKIQGASLNRSDGLVDQLSAVLILQSYLDAMAAAHTEQAEGEEAVEWPAGESE